MNKKLLVIGVIVVLIIASVWASVHFSSNTPQQTSSQTRTAITTVSYSCDKNKTITATYYDGPEALQPSPGKPPTPTGSVDVSIGGAPTTTLSQTISADGIRYANSDESLVFWSKGNTALVMHNNSMDLEYTNCVESSL